jgi:pyruvate dehydrogenase E1 component alpha subunit
MRDSLFDAPPGDPREMFDHVYATRTPQLDAQRALLEQELRAGEER